MGGKEAEAFCILKMRSKYSVHVSPFLLFDWSRSVRVPVVTPCPFGALTSPAPAPDSPSSHCAPSSTDAPVIYSQKFDWCDLDVIDTWLQWTMHWTRLPFISAADSSGCWRLRSWSTAECCSPEILTRCRCWPSRWREFWCWSHGALSSVWSCSASWKRPTSCGSRPKWRSTGWTWWSSGSVRDL